MNHWKILSLASVLTFMVLGCNSANDYPIKDKKMAKSIVEPTKGNIAAGVVWFTETSKGVSVSADFYGLTPGKHGFHVHEKGDCSAHDASSAGGHFNPEGVNHGGPNSSVRHVGDLGNIDADSSGYAHYERVDHMIKLEGAHSIIGKSIVIHKDPDDLVSQPTGNAGARIGCGPIERVQP